MFSLPRIENALPGRDGYEVEIFGMEGIPVPDVADYKRRKEIELGLNPGTITQPPPKKAKYESRVLSEEELRAQLEAHKALMGANDPSSSTTAPADSGANGAVYSTTVQTYATPGTKVAIQRILRIKITVEVEVLAIVRPHRLIQVFEVLHPVVEPRERHVIQIEAVLEGPVLQQFPNLGMSQASRHSNG